MNDEDTQMLVTTFGLRHTLKTLVGDDFVRGVSGGERKRVSLAEVVRRKLSIPVGSIINNFLASNQSFGILLG